MAQNKHVTLVITHALKPGQEADYEAWLGRIMPIAAEFPGHLGANVIRPGAGMNEWNIVIRFDSLDNLYAWTCSSQRKQLVAEVEPLLEGGDRTEVRTDAAFWFTPPAPRVRQPKRWKQFLITLMVIFPSVNLVGWLSGQMAGAHRGELWLNFLNNACVVALVVWFWMPITTRLFARWLKR